MSFNLESGKSKEINETPEVKVDSEQLSETEETAENFDNCSLNEVQDSKGNEVNAKSLEDAEEDYDDCEAKVEEMEVKKTELAEDEDDFNDCGKETDGQYVAEVTYTTDGEISQEEASAELQEAYNECDDPEDMQQLKENANENEHIEVHNAEVVERPENSEKGEEVTEEEYEEAQKELDEAQENLESQQEAAQEYQEDLENQINKQENEVSDGTENINDKFSESTEETEDSDEVEETTEGTEDFDEVEETTEETENSDEVEEATEETENSEGEEIGIEDLENMEDGSKVETSEIDEENLNEDVSQKVEEKTDTELSDETKEQISEEVSDEINSEAENNEISTAETEKIIEEKKTESVESVEKQFEVMDGEIEQKAGEIAEQDDLTEEEAKEQISEEVSESANKNLSDGEVDAMIEEKSEAIEETIEEKADEQETVDAVEETADYLEDEKTEQFSEQSDQSLQERIDDAFEKEDVTASEINSLRDEHSAELQAKIEEKRTTEAELKTKFDEVLSKEKGSDEYRQSLQEYNALQDKKSELDEQTATMEKQQYLLDKKSIELREAQIQKGSEAMAASAATLAGVNRLQERYDQTYYDTKVDKTELASIRDDSCSAIKELSAEKDSIKQAMDVKMDEISEYVISNNMDRYDTAHDLRYQQMSAEYNAMKESYDRISFSIVKLEENYKLIDEQIGVKPQKSLENSRGIFGNYEIDKHGFVKGDNFEQYIENWENYSLESHKTELFDEAKMHIVSPSLIEGIRVSEYDVDNPSIFWSQHKKGGTEESFEKIAHHIPEVQVRLNAGETLNDLMQDYKVGSCAAIYFHPDNVPKVIKCGDYYEFQENGRHRILAARNVGYDIPVKVIGERKSAESTVTHNEGGFDAPFVENLRILSDDINQKNFDERYENEKTIIIKPKDIDASENVYFPPRSKIDSAEYTYITDSLQSLKVEYRPIQKLAQNRTTKEIVDHLSGGDMTKGSCSSLALAYTGNKAGYDVLDFRDGESRVFFSSRSSIQKISELPGVKSVVLKGINDFETANQLMINMQKGKEYYLATGGHAAIVRYIGDEYQYLELQHPSNGNGWHTLNDDVIRYRFGCQESRMFECSSFLIDIDTLSDSSEFRNILGFINTAESNQIKGGKGSVR